MINTECDYEFSEKISIRGYKPNYNGHLNQIKKAARIISEAKKPLLYVGGGVIMSNSAPELTSFARENNLPVTMTLLGLGAFPGRDKQSLGMLGMHGTYWSNQAVNNCDVLVSLGARFDDRVTGKVDTFATQAYKIHVDIDPTAIDKNVLVDLPIVGDVKKVLGELKSAMPATPQIDDWWDEINSWKQDCPLSYDMSDGRLRTQYVLERLCDLTEGNALIVSDVGQHQMLIAQYYKFNNPRSLLNSGGLGTMGFSVPAAIGASFGVKDKQIISISGDGGFQMNIQELITAVANNVPVKFIVINNSFLGMVRQWQELFHAEKYSFTDLGNSNPDFVKIGEALGIPSWSTDKIDEVNTLLERALDINDGPSLLEFKVVKEEMVFPMVPSGGSISDMILERLNPKRMV
jgi:acetolactate synthase-1/2/3 large subunit